MKENAFQKRVLRDLKKLENCYLHKHQAGSIRGIPDIVCCINSIFVCLELKHKKIKLSRGREMLQKWTLRRMRDAGGIALFTSPETWDAVLVYLTKLSKEKEHDQAHVQRFKRALHGLCIEKTCELQRVQRSQGGVECNENH